MTIPRQLIFVAVALMIGGFAARVGDGFSVQSSASARDWQDESGCRYA